MGRTIILANQTHHHHLRNNNQSLISSNPSSHFPVFPSVWVVLRFEITLPNSQKFNLFSPLFSFIYCSPPKTNLMLFLVRNFIWGFLLSKNYAQISTLFNLDASPLVV